MHMNELHNYKSPTGEVWNAGDLCALTITGPFSLRVEVEYVTQGHLIGATGGLDEPLIFLGVSYNDDYSRLIAYLLSFRFGACWRFVWSDQTGGLKRVQQLQPDVSSQ